MKKNFTRERQVSQNRHFVEDGGEWYFVNNGRTTGMRQRIDGITRDHDESVYGTGILFALEKGEHARYLFIANDGNEYEERNSYGSIDSSIPDRKLELVGVFKEGIITYSEETEDGKGSIYGSDAKKVGTYTLWPYGSEKIKASSMEKLLKAYNESEEQAE